jgi:hypothetical protein
MVRSYPLLYGESHYSIFSADTHRVDDQITIHLVYEPGCRALKVFATSPAFIGVFPSTQSSLLFPLEPAV